MSQGITIKGKTASGQNVEVRVDDQGNLTSGGSSSYGLRYDEGATYTYIGEALPGILNSEPNWRIKRLTNSDNTILWSDSSAKFDKIWDNRASYTYS